MAQMYKLACCACSLSFFITATKILADTDHSLPEEYVTTGEQSTALANGGSLSSSGYSAVRANPAMLAADKLYTMGGGYHWPSKGRDFYEGGIVDGKTASVAAGCSYTSSLDEYQGAWAGDGSIKGGDTPVRKRAALALAYSFKTVALGLSGGFVEASDPAVTFDSDADRVKGYTLGAGMMAGITPSLRAGLSVENMANRKVSFAAPTIYRAGLAWAAVKNFNVYLDLRRREAVDAFEGRTPSFGLASIEDDSSGAVASEGSATLGGMTRVFDLLRFSLAGGVAQKGSQNVLTAAGGVALVNKSFSLSYGVQKPNTRLAAVHHSANLGFDVSL